MACKACRAKKIKCDRTRPVCQNCRQRASQCSYTRERRTRRWTEADAQLRRCSVSGHAQRPPLTGTTTDHRPSQRLTDAGQPTTGLAHLVTNGVARSDVEPDRLAPDWHSAVAAAPSHWQQQHHMDPCSIASLFAQMTRDGEAILQTPAASSHGQDECLLDNILDGDDVLLEFPRFPTSASTGCERGSPTRIFSARPSKTYGMAF